MSEIGNVIRIRLMQASDVPLGLSLCRFAGWNQLEGDWHRLLALNPRSIFVAEHDGVPCGTASIICYGTKLAWIGMVLVHPDHRRHGVGSVLIKYCLDFLGAAQIECIKLDATEQGRTVYLKHGFEDEESISRCLLPKRPDVFGCCLQPIEEMDWQSIGKFDHDIFGADRLPLLMHLATDGVTAIAKTSNSIQGYGFARTGYNASFLGPVVATNKDCGSDLVASLLGKLPAGRGIYWDIFPGNVNAKELAESFEFSVERTLMRMRHGTPIFSRDINKIYGASGFETG